MAQNNIKKTIVLCTIIASLSACANRQQNMPLYDTVNVVVDLYDCVKKLFMPTLIEQINHLKKSERFQVTSELINIAGHYRNYFATRLWKYTNFYFF